jgi:hypothetical protein
MVAVQSPANLQTRHIVIRRSSLSWQRGGLSGMPSGTCSAATLTRRRWRCGSCDFATGRIWLPTGATLRLHSGYIASHSGYIASHSGYIASHWGYIAATFRLHCFPFRLHCFPLRVYCFPLRVYCFPLRVYFFPLGLSCFPLGIYRFLRRLVAFPIASPWDLSLPTSRLDYRSSLLRS